MTIDTILQEIKEVPENRLEELHLFVNTLIETKNPVLQKRKEEILSFGGILNEMTEEEYKEFTEYNQHTRTQLFNRNTVV